MLRELRGSKHLTAHDRKEKPQRTKEALILKNVSLPFFFAV
jgi:hypothetical protein